MLRWAIFFAIVSIIAGLLGLTGTAHLAAGIARVLLGTIAVLAIVGIMLVLLLRATHGLPWFVPCLECGALGQWWYSDAVTFLQGCGLGTVAAASLVWARRRITRKERTADV